MKRLLALLLVTALFAEEQSAPIVSKHSIQMGEETLEYSVTVGSGEVGYIAYVKEGEGRPITFAFNGGPGSSSVWLHMGTFGPRRVVSPEEGQGVAPPYKIVDNLETILDVTDIVFVDPPGTGLSDVPGDERSKEVWGVKEDTKVIGAFIRDYLTENGRWNSKKYLAGESYGAVRIASVAEYLQDSFYGIYLNGLIFISAALDYQTFCFHPDNPLPYFLFLPTYATTAWYHGKFLPEGSVKEAAEAGRKLASSIYAMALLCPKYFDADFLYAELAKVTGLSSDTVRRYGGKIDEMLFFQELLSEEGKVVGRFDSRNTGAFRRFHRSEDPSSSVIEGIFSGGLHEYLHKELGKVSPYAIFSLNAHMKWNFGKDPWDGYPSAMKSLRNALVKNPAMKVFVGCGYYDLATPFATVEYCFDHLDVPGTEVQMEHYEGGHMYYLNPTERVKFKEDLVRFYGN